MKQVEETNELVGEYVNLYQVHSATFESGILSDPRVHEALSRCRTKRGWSIGLSVSSPRQNEVLREARKLRATDADLPLFDSVQCTFNLLEQRPGAELKEAHDAGMDIVVKEGLANGRTLRNASVIKYADKLNCTPDQLALGWILAQPFEPRVLSGAVTPDQLSSNFEAERIASQLRTDNALLEEIGTACVMKSEDYWEARSALAWN